MKLNRFNFNLSDKHADILKNLSAINRRKYTTTIELLLEKEADLDAKYKNSLAQNNA